MDAKADGGCIGRGAVLKTALDRIDHNAASLAEIAARMSAFCTGEPERADFGGVTRSGDGHSGKMASIMVSRPLILLRSPWLLLPCGHASEKRK